jgi:hypothetical protein
VIMQGDKKKSVALIMSRLGSPDEKVEQAPTVDDVEQDHSIPLESAAEEILMALENKSPKALVEALKYFLEMCEPEKSE